jgi:hypothetical protein
MEAIFKANNERMASLFKDTSFCFDLLDLVLFNEVNFVDDLDGVEFPIVFLLGQDYFPESSLPQHSDHLKVVLSQLLSISGDKGLSILSVLLHLDMFHVDEIGEGLAGKFLGAAAREHSGLHGVSFGVLFEVDFWSEPNFDWGDIKAFP